MMNTNVPKETAVRIAVAHTKIAHKLICACCADRLGIKGFNANVAEIAANEVLDYVYDGTKKIDYVVDPETTKEEENYYLTLNRFYDIDVDLLEEKVGRAIYFTWELFLTNDRPETLMEAIELMTRALMYLTGGKPYEGTNIFGTDFYTIEDYTIVYKNDIPAIYTKAVESWGAR